MKEQITAFLIKYKFRLIYTVIAFVIAVLLLTIGFWPTFLLVLCIAVGWIIGARKDDKPARIERFIEGIIARRRE